MLKKAKIAIVGAGVAGSTTAIYLGKLGLDVTLFEKEKSLVTGPPFCHLHAGGNLYRDISDAQCITLLKQSIDFLKFYPFVVDYRPTVIALPTTDKSNPEALLARLKLIQKEYAKLIQNDPSNEVLGKSNDYFKLYSRAEIEVLKTATIVSTPQTLDEWMTPVAQKIDLSKVQFPLIMVQEYGLNLFRLASGALLTIEEMQSVNLRTETSVTSITKEDNQWKVGYEKADNQQYETFDYLINATGFRTGKIDDMLGAPCKRMVEFKAAYVTQWQGSDEILFPEIIFHGERGTPQGMGQFTPYPGGYFQLHGMTNNITLYKDGLVANSKFSCQPELGQNFIEKIEKSWDEKETAERTNAAIEHLSQFIPDFSTATVASKPLFGAQQIPGDDPSLRVAEVSFPAERYARCEIVKVSSVIDMIQAIVVQLIELNYLDNSAMEKNVFNALENLEEEALQKVAHNLCIERNYPTCLSNRNVAKK